MPDWMLFALGSAVCAALTAILAKIGVQGVPAALATFIRTAVVLGVTALAVCLRREWAQTGRLDSRAWTFLALSGIATALSWLCYFRALQSGPASIVAPIDKLSLPLAIVLAVAVLGERLTAGQWLGAGLMTAGALLVALG